MGYYLIFKDNKVQTKEERSVYRKKIPRERRDSIMQSKLKAQRGTCFWCPETINMSGHLDHIKPLYYGGKSNSGNLVASCRDCNLTKGVDQIEILNPETVKQYKRDIKKYNRSKSYRKYKSTKPYAIYMSTHAYAFTRIDTKIIDSPI